MKIKFVKEHCSGTKIGTVLDTKDTSTANRLIKSGIAIELTEDEAIEELIKAEDSGNVPASEEKEEAKDKE